MRRDRVVGALAVVAVLLLVGLGVSGALPGTSNPVFDGMTPVRVLDTREGLGAPKAKLGSGGVLELAIAGQHGIPADATSVVMNVTAVDASQVTHLTVWPTGQTMPLASSLNPAPGPPDPNLVTVTIGAGGKVSIFNNSGQVHVIADVVGYYRDHGHDDRYYTEAEVDATVSSLEDRLAAVESTTTTSVVPGGGEFVAIMDSGIVSTDDGGTHWVARGWPQQPLRSIATDGAGHFVGVGSSGALLLTEDEGWNWENPQTPPGDKLYEVATDGLGRWVAVGYSVWYSTDNGLNWTISSSPPALMVTDVATDGLSAWMTDGTDDAGTGHFAWHSSNGGDQWQGSITADAFGSGISDVVSDGAGTWVALAGNMASMQAWRSIDGGKTWFSSGQPLPGDVTVLATDKAGLWLAAGNESGTIWRSSNSGESWELASTSPDGIVEALATNESGTWVAVGATAVDYNGAAWWSTDSGSTWTPAATPPVDHAFSAVSASSPTFHG